MVNVLIPAMGKSMFFKEYYFPKLLLEINGETVLEKIINNYESIADKRFIFVLNQKDCSEFHIDRSIRLLAPNSEIIILKNDTGGALCTCLLCADYINNDEQLIIANCDQIIDANYMEVIEYFETNYYESGVISFSSIHPRWSYINLEEDRVIQLAEKRPISKHAVAGFYYFEKGSDYIEASKKAILKENTYDDKYYISAALNELILMNKKIGFYEVAKEKYHSFYSPEKIREYEKECAK